MLSKPQRAVLAVLSFGIASACQCRLDRIARCLPFCGMRETLVRRFQRFLAAGGDIGTAQTALCRMVLALLPQNERLAVLVDETSLSDRLRVIVRLLKRLKAACPTPAIVVQADRGIGCSPALLKAIAALGWQYLVRVQKTVRLTQDETTSHAFASVPLTSGEMWTQTGKAFKKAQWLSCRAIGYFGIGHKEPWYLLTNSAEVTASEYGQRMWEELAFRDLKSDGFDWQSSRVWLPAHAERLFLAMALAMVLLLLLGSEAEQSRRRPVLLTRHKGRRVSLFDLGLTLLQWCIGRGEPLPDTLQLSNKPPPLSKTVVQ